ncbi:MAG: NUDIX hydrolase [Bacilli bacterium]|nr:NUDIX hydrolase [Bacilli bacterium]
MMLGFSFFIGIIILLFYSLFVYYSDKKWQKKPIQNFPFIYHGVEYWYSRSVACVLLCFGKNADGEWCVLANKRGSGTPDFQGYWNCSCGYLDYNEFGEQCVIRETREETNFNVPIEKVKLFGVSTDPNNNRQNVSLQYYAVIDDIISDEELSSKNSEKDEVEAIKWIPISKIDSYEWAFAHDSLIKKIITKEIF